MCGFFCVCSGLISGWIVAHNFGSHIRMVLHLNGSVCVFENWIRLGIIVCILSNCICISAFMTFYERKVKFLCCSFDGKSCSSNLLRLLNHLGCLILVLAWDLGASWTSNNGLSWEESSLIRIKRCWSSVVQTVILVFLPFS